MKKEETLFTMSGTSQAAAVTSGVVALMLQANPTLTPDTVKCRLLSSASPAVTSGGSLAYSIFQQGAGLINAVNAVQRLHLD
jgi:serine protease AprX